MIDYNVGYFPQLDSFNSPTLNFVNAKFVPKLFNIGEFTHFGKPSEEEDTEYLNLDYLDFANQVLEDQDDNYLWTYYGPDIENDSGDQVLDYDLILWTPSSVKNYNYIKTDNLPDPLYDVDRAAAWLEDHAHVKSTHRCAEYVRKSLLYGKVNMDDRPRTAGLYLAYFRNKKEWTEINPSLVKKGDVCVTKNEGKGHISLYTGKDWISDFKLKGPHVYSYAQDGKNTFYFRYTG